MSVSPLATLQKLADAIERGEPLALRFGAALRDGGPLEGFGLDYAPWLRGWLKAQAVERRDRRIAELGRRLAARTDGVERKLAAMLKPGAKPLSDPTEEALRADAVTAHAAMHPNEPHASISRNTIRRARKNVDEHGAPKPVATRHP